jgi:UDP-N-acetylmuramoyl-tripeptide--D-alanyl-D-alanine ligase
VRDWSPARLADAAGARLLRAPAVAGGPSGVSVDSRTLAPGELFVALAGANTDGGRHAGTALAAGAWGAVVAPEHADPALAAGRAGAVLIAERPLEALGALARAWRRELGARVVAITGSTGKTSTKDILAALLAPSLRIVASAQNHNTEIGMPLEILAAPAGTEVLVLELAMRGAGQIAELTAICEPDVGVIVNVGPAHIELLGSVEAIAAAKAELVVGMPAGATAVLPAGEPLLEPFAAREDIRIVRFGPGGDVAVLGAGAGGVVVGAFGGRLTLEPGFRAPHLLSDLCAALAAAHALGVAPPERLSVSFASLRGERIALPGGVTVVNDCYNANPMSMRAALDDLAATAPGRRVAVLGDMLELGAAGEERYHRELGREAAAAGVALLVTVGPRATWTGESYRGGGEHVHATDAAQAAALLAPRLRPGDTVLVKGSRGVALERVAAALAEPRRHTAR